MIAHIDGILSEKNTDSVVIDAGGVGFELNVSAATLSKCPATGKSVKLYAHLAVREDAMELYGFISAEDVDNYSIISDELGLGLSEEQRRLIARDRAQNMRNYIPYPGIRVVLETLARTHRLGVISDTWPSIGAQLDYLGVSGYFSFETYSCFVGVFKPDRRMYLDALEKSGVRAEETVFIDDSLRNLEGAAALGIFPVLIAANPASDVETSFLKIRDLRELIRQD